MLNKPPFSPPIRRTLPTPPFTPPLPISAMDISSVRFQPAPVKAQAAITSTHGHLRMIWPERPKLNNYILLQLENIEANERFPIRFYCVN